MTHEGSTVESWKKRTKPWILPVRTQSHDLWGGHLWSQVIGELMVTRRSLSGSWLVFQPLQGQQFLWDKGASFCLGFTPSQTCRKLKTREKNRLTQHRIPSRSGVLLKSSQILLDLYPDTEKSKREFDFLWCQNFHILNIVSERIKVCRCVLIVGH